MAKTVFQRIIDRELPARIEHEDDQCIVIHDREPEAPVHVLIVPKAVIPRIGEG
jgi:histidine triad (HIT) family protein